MGTQEALAALAALAQESRLAVYRLLVQAGPSGLLAGEIAERLGIPPATLSFHLRHLGHAQLLRSQRLGRFIRYTANIDTMNTLMSYLMENCCGGDLGACLPASDVDVMVKAGGCK